jgi:hypothetical protein
MTSSTALTGSCDDKIELNQSEYKAVSFALQSKLGPLGTIHLCQGRAAHPRTSARRFIGRFTAQYLSSLSRKAERNARSRNMTARGEITWSDTLHDFQQYRLKDGATAQIAGESLTAPASTSP